MNPDMESFLAAGAPPIYIGFGSSVGDAAMRARAAEMSERIAQENGADRASEQIESTLR